MARGALYLLATLGFGDVVATAIVCAELLDGPDEFGDEARCTAAGFRGIAGMYSDQLEQARDHFEDAVTLARVGGYVSRLPMMLCDWADTERQLGNQSQALLLLEEARRSAELIGSEPSRVAVMGNTADVLAARGDATESVRIALEAASSSYLRFSALETTLSLTTLLGCCALAGHRTAAEMVYARLLHEFERHGTEPCFSGAIVAHIIDVFGGAPPPLPAERRPIPQLLDDVREAVALATLEVADPG